MRTDNMSSDPEKAASEAAKGLARLMERQLGYAEGHIDPIAFRLFIQAYWSRVSAYAHAIHDGANRATVATAERELVG